MRLREEEQQQFANALIAHLDAAPLPAPVGHRLRAARQLAVGRRRASRKLSAVLADLLAWPRLAAQPWLPAAMSLCVLVLGVGLTTLQGQPHDPEMEKAAIDAALLSDVLPPHAYTDVAFMEYLNQQTVAQVPPEEQ